MGEARRKNAAGLDRAMNRKLPSLDEHLGEGRGEGFVDWVERMFALDYAMLKAGTEQEQLFVRLLRAQMVAAVESLRQEAEAGGDAVKLIQLLPRTMGTVSMYALASILKDDAPLRDFATTLFEEFRFGAKEAADQIAEANEREAAE
jgi:hypothetical protein